MRRSIIGGVAGALALLLGACGGGTGRNGAVGTVAPAGVTPTVVAQRPAPAAPTSAPTTAALVPTSPPTAVALVPTNPPTEAVPPTEAPAPVPAVSPTTAPADGPDRSAPTAVVRPTQRPRPTPTKPAPAVEVDVPDFEIVAYRGSELLGGSRTRFSEVFKRGRPVVLNFWRGQ